MSSAVPSKILRLAAALLALAAWPSAGAQTPTEPASPEVEAAEPNTPEPFFEAIDVEVVNIDVWVTDREGQPVTGLTRDDFEVTRDGQPVEISNFYAVVAGRPAPDEEPDAPKPGTTEPSTTEASSPQPPPLPARDEPLVAPEHRLWLIVYVDQFNLDPIERNRILPELAIFLGRTLQDGDRAMIVTYDRSLEVRQPFTDRLGPLRDTLDALREESGQATVRRREQMETLKNIDDSDDYGEALSYARFYAEAQMNDIGHTLEALQRLVDSLAGLPGRKALLHVSSGMPMLAGEEMFHAVADKFGSAQAFSEIPRHATTRRFERLARRANEQRVTFHTMDAGGLRGIEFGAAEYGGFVQPGIRSMLDSVVPENLQSPLRLMAHETGGRAILNRNEVLPALDEVVQDLRSFYSLGISSAGGREGRYHRIEVKLRESSRGVRLRHRAGYRSKKIDTRIRESLRAALLYAHEANPLNVEVQWGRPQPRGKDEYLLPIRLTVPLRDVVLLPVGSSKHEARLELFVGAVGSGSATSPIDDAPFGLRLANEHVDEARNESLVHTHKLIVAPGRQKVGVAVLDVFGGQSSVVTGILDIGTAAGGDPSP